MPTQHPPTALLTLCLALLAMGLLPGGGQAAEPEQTGPLEVVVRNVRSAQGSVRVSLYRDAASFRKEAQAIRLLAVPAHSGEVRLRFEDLPPGQYAVMLYHDENANAKLDLRFGMLPIEGYGLSRNPEVMGPPKFEDSAVTFTPGMAGVTIEMRY